MVVQPIFSGSIWPWLHLNKHLSRLAFPLLHLTLVIFETSSSAPCKKFISKEPRLQHSNYICVDVRCGTILANNLYRPFSRLSLLDASKFNYCSNAFLLH